MKSADGATIVGRGWICVAALLAIVAIHRWVLEINAVTAALYMLLVVLGTATRWGFTESIFTSVVAVLVFNFFFLPPVGTFTIADPENWVALFAFLITAITASQLSADAKRRAEEAMAGRNEIGRLYELSRALLMEEGEDALERSVLLARQIFGLKELAFYDALGGEIRGATQDSPTSASDLAGVAKTGQPLTRSPLSIIPVRLGTQIIGSMGVIAPDLRPAMRDSIAGLLALSYERARALRQAAAAEAARRNEEFRSSLLDALAHDLKTPLTAIRTCATHLVTMPPRDEQVRTELVSIIDQESRRLQATITEALELARIESGDLRLQREPVKLRAVIDGALDETRDENRERYSVEVAPELSADLDVKLVRRAIMQVLENAKKYSPHGAPIGIGAARYGDNVTIEVRDEGPGFQPEELDRVFDKFFRGRRVRTRVEGTGMGLAIARAIVEAHGGTIRAGNYPAGGAVITISLPAPAVH